jgi:quercetin dioxygenase-like cupin family protein
MLSRRDLAVAAVTFGLTLSALKIASSETPVMKSTTVDWNSMQIRETKFGSQRRVFQAPTATLDELECHITTLNPGEAPHAAHKHADEELILVKEGTVESTLEGGTKVLGPGSVIFQASNQMHGLRNVGQTPATYFVVKWNSPGMLKAKQKQ